MTRRSAHFTAWAALAMLAGCADLGDEELRFTADPALPSARFEYLDHWNNAAPRARWATMQVGFERVAAGGFAIEIAITPDPTANLTEFATIRLCDWDVATRAPGGQWAYSLRDAAHTARGGAMVAVLPLQLGGRGDTPMEFEVYIDNPGTSPMILSSADYDRGTLLRIRGAVSAGGAGLAPSVSAATQAAGLAEPGLVNPLDRCPPRAAGL